MRLHVALPLAAVVAFAAPAVAEDRPDRAADWLKKPTAQSLMALAPTRAIQEGRDGKATITCKVTVQGTLRDCKVISESPADYGFGGAALGLTPQFLMRPAMQDGRPVESTVTIPINWSGYGGLSAARGTTGSRTAMAAPTPRRAQVFTNLPFRDAPDHVQVLAAYPPKARAARVAGVASLSCRIREGGRLGSCETVREEPKDYGFAAAAKALAPEFQAPIDLEGGDAMVGARSMVLVTFDPKTIDGGSQVVGRPKWIGVPQFSDIAAVLPPKAREAKVYQARVLMTCTVLEGGAVNACKTESEEPAGLGYDKAAESLAQYFKLSVWTEEGLPTVGGQVRIPLRFDLQPAAAAKP